MRGGIDSVAGNMAAAVVFDRICAGVDSESSNGQKSNMMHVWGIIMHGANVDHHHFTQTHLKRQLPPHHKRSGPPTQELSVWEQVLQLHLRMIPSHRCKWYTHLAKGVHVSRLLAPSCIMTLTAYNFVRLNLSCKRTHLTQCS